MPITKDVVEFDWDEGNIGKNKEKHDVEDKEAEEPFLDDDKVIYKDILHSKDEDRFILLGKTKQQRLLCVVYTKRGKKVRIISARDMNKKREVIIYEKAT